MRFHSIMLIALMSAKVSLATPGDEDFRSGHFKRAAQLYQQGAEQGDGKAALKLGLMIAMDKVGGYGSAGAWYIKACDLGNVKGCHNTGVGYEYGHRGLPKNHDEARRYYLMAANQGYMPSQYNLGTLHANKYVPDDVEGLTWLILARRQANMCIHDEQCQFILTDPKGHFLRLKERMSPQQILQAEKRADQWQAAHETKAPDVNGETARNTRQDWHDI